MPISTRNLLALTNNNLRKEETWLKEAYVNIVTKLVRSALLVVPKFDPIASKYYGIDSIRSNQSSYQALLEATSYFWASKGGRGRLLEKVLASVAGEHSSSGTNLSQIPTLLASRKERSSQMAAWKMINSTKKLKFDLVNVVGDTLIILELKNRVDSGGTAAREEALGKKFFTICKMIEDDNGIFEYGSRKQDLPEMLSYFGIKKLEMYTGFLYNIHGNEASMTDDRIGGFYSRSKTLFKEYLTQSHTAKIDFDESNLTLQFNKRGINVLVGTTYGNEVTEKFLKKDFPIKHLMEKIFPKTWDDIWLSLTVTISELSILRKYGTNHLIKIGTMLSTNRQFRDRFNCFTKDPNNQGVIDSIFSIINESKSFRTEGNFDDQYILDCLYAYASYYVNGDKAKNINTDEEELI